MPWGGHCYAAGRPVGLDSIGLSPVITHGQLDVNRVRLLLVSGLALGQTLTERLPAERGDVALIGGLTGLHVRPGPQAK